MYEKDIKLSVIRTLSPMKASSVLAEHLESNVVIYLDLTSASIADRKFLFLVLGQLVLFYPMDYLKKHLRYRTNSSEVVNMLTNIFKNSRMFYRQPLLLDDLRSKSIL